MKKLRTISIMKTLILLLLTMTLSAMDLVGTLKREEGLRLEVYKCSEGFPTIGYGHRCAANTAAITKEQAEKILAEDIAKAQKSVEALIGKNAPAEAKDIVTAMVFQMGVTGVSEFKTMLKCIKAKDYTGASVAMLDSKWNKQTPKRAKRMSELMAAVK